LTCDSQGARNGANVGAVDRHCEHRARPTRFAIDQDRATAADALLASDVSADQVKLLPKRVRERKSCLHFELVQLAIDPQRDSMLAHRARSAAAAKARLTIVGITRTRYRPSSVGLA